MMSVLTESSFHYLLNLDFVSDMCFSPFDDCFLATGSFDGDVRILFFNIISHSH